MGKGEGREGEGGGEVERAGCIMAVGGDEPGQFATMFGDPALSHTSKTAKVIKDTLLRAPCHNIKRAA